MNIVFAVCFPFPYGSASSMRARNIYKLLELAGHNVHVIADYNTTVFMPIASLFPMNTFMII